MSRFKWLGFGGAALIVLTAIMLQTSDSVHASTLAAVAHGCCLLGAIVGLSTQAGLRWVIAFVSMYIGWRLGFFPVLVLSGHAAAISEWTLRYAGLPPMSTYAVLYMGLAAGTAVATCLAYRALTTTSLRSRALFAAPLVPAILISFTAPGDLSWLPDQTLWSNSHVAEVRDPQRNVYRDSLAETSLGPRTTLLTAASLTYDLIPKAPWASRVKGTLEAEFLANPRGSSVDRVVEHFRAFSAAHSKLKGEEQ